MTDKAKMPKLTTDEVLLLVDAYFRLKQTTEADDLKEIVLELSEAMRDLPFFPEYRDNPTFRSESGMRMCLKNVEYADPEGKSKFGHGSGLQREVLKYYGDKKDLLRKLALAIRNVSKETFPLNYCYQDSPLGIMIPSYHEYLERTNKTLKAIKSHLFDDGKTICKLCGRDLSTTYTEATMLMEVHIDVPIFENVPGCSVTPSKVISVCPTCHKLLHSKLQNYESACIGDQIKR